MSFTLRLMTAVDGDLNVVLNMNGKKSAKISTQKKTRIKIDIMELLQALF